MILDVSVDQGIIDFSEVKATDYVCAVVAKATEGVTYQDSLFINNHNGFKRVGVPFGAYHFFRPKDTAMAQAQNFLRTINGYEGQVLPMVDVEVSDDVSYDILVSRLVSFVQLVDATLHGQRCIIYGGLDFWSRGQTMNGYDGFAGHPFWVAAYNNDPTLDVSGTGWKQWTLWQYSDGKNKTPVPGIGANVDRSRLNPKFPLEVILRGTT